MPKFVHLHTHSHYSLLDGLPKIPQLVDYVKELGMGAVGLTDHGVMYGAVEFFKEARARGIKPIIGCEVYMAFEGHKDKRPNIDAKSWHMILLCKNQKGYENLVKLVTTAHLEGYYYKPRIDEELLEKHAEGLIGTSACLNGKIPKLLLAGKLDEAETLARHYSKIFGSDSFYLELQYHQNIPEQQVLNKKIIELAQKTGLPLVATNDIHYLRAEDAEAQDVLMLINTGSDPNDPERLTLQGDDFSMLSPAKMAEIFKDTPQALENSQKIADMCDFEFELGKTRLPSFQVPPGKTAESYLTQLCEEGLARKYPHITPEIRERMDYELSIINKTGFAGYILIVHDFTKWALEKRISRNARGSAAGSLVCYLTDITSVDPIKYDLLFERFLNPERISMPDIDMDFTDRRRDEVIKYVGEKYGHDHVAQIITFGTMAARAVVRDVGRALQYPYSYCDTMAKMIPLGMDLTETLEKVAEFKELYKNDPQATKLIDLGLKLEGVARHASTHACGVVISADALDQSVPLQHPPGKEDDSIITQYEMHAIEDLGLLKMDFLGLKNLTIIEDTLARIFVIRGESINIEKIPHDDQKTFKLLQDAITTSVFQLESDGMKRYLKELKPTEFEDIAAMVALYRPGPMQFIPDYIERKHGRQQITYIIPELEPLLKSTQGIMIYQEQLMKLAQVIAGFTLGEADVLRKAVGKKIKALLDAQETKFIDGAVKNGFQKKVAEELWQWILPFAAYGFNKSHSVSYATIAYQTAYLKAHYPVEFMASVLTSEKADVERIALLIEECKKMDIEVLPPNINESLKNFTVVPGQQKIRFGLLAIKNVGENIIDTVALEVKTNGKFTSVSDFIHRVASKDLNKKSMEALIKAGAFDEFAERNQMLQNLEKLLEIARENQKNKSTGQIGLFAGAPAIMKTTEIKMDAAVPAKMLEKLTWEKELLGLYVSSHPLNSFRKLFETRTTAIAKIDKTWVNKKVLLGGLITQAKKIITKTGKPMLFIKFEDLTAKTEVVVFPNLMEKNPVALQENKIVFFAGRVDDRNGEIKIVADDVQEIVQEA
ncbi:MAG: DNA polymerase III subunit alpha [Candidatus Staskawiczbacteria bacterium RIFCSPHIGHO2_02_FULL_43_16]|uniref:DNA polymerase III subunit alpha n=1 Tax=Candidatus Staskawiczbacteria bacterium RIFCSPHIGHO2_01_FULL_41_41 TaxID=1802203 RepID=A0A1G2HUQ1_9BACT|nr:MAG: DNA polymerase III subunit alpha [Candidatus Staskawiczbacteria bacterium RIFCSPHIGHO2_01_FULL_41_41]OGZ69104.1 MAG: DNA polymerase III subunit alpha [Candidatus Staskawiczbacteria bacterium RIFCSPHIGHO2_02_FULL_43_16]OGZ74469.1 MAG: DNA polymerase III subunit alpha [Candidatus Staskawiczbacteria bacterium RIFCSPLOWO2_01_FULL_43_17b]